MAVEVVMPQMGESIFEGTITKWLKKPGDKVERDEPLFEISTDKVDAEIPSPAAGVLREIKVAEGQNGAHPDRGRRDRRRRCECRLTRPLARLQPRQQPLRLAGPAAGNTSPAPPRRAGADTPAEKTSDRVAGHAEPEAEQEDDRQTEEEKAADSPLARRSCGASRKRIISISPWCGAPALADASARKTSSRLWPSLPRRQLPAPVKASCDAAGRRRPGPRDSCADCSRGAPSARDARCRASASTSAITKCSR